MSLNNSEQLFDNQQNNHIQNTGNSTNQNTFSFDEEVIDTLLEVAKDEYLHQRDRTEKLINKISIIFTISSAAIAYEITHLSFNGFCYQSLLTILSIVFLFISLIILIYVFCNIKTEVLQITRYISSISNTQIEFKKQNINRLLLGEYCRINCNNKKHINNLFKMLNTIIILLSIALVLFFFAIV